MIMLMSSNHDGDDNAAGMQSEGESDRPLALTICIESTYVWF